MRVEILPLLGVIKHLTTLVEKMEHKIDALCEQMREEHSTLNDQLEALQDSDEWEEESEEESGEESEDESVKSAPATFSYKVQRVR